VSGLTEGVRYLSVVSFLIHNDCIVVIARGTFHVLVSSQHNSGTYCNSGSPQCYDRSVLTAKQIWLICQVLLFTFSIALRSLRYDPQLPGVLQPAFFLQLWCPILAVYSIYTISSLASWSIVRIYLMVLFACHPFIFV
jgi:hypothetical protein